MDARLERAETEFAFPRSVDEVIEGESIADIVFYHHCGVINEVICSDDIQIFAGAAKPA